jgi:NAD(P) transhydrogenase subunit alpha
MDGMALLTIFVLAVFVGFEVVAKVSSTLHTPLMSGANAIHGIILVGAILVAGQTESTPALLLGLLAVLMATVNLVGGFVVTDRMLEMFKGKGKGKGKPAVTADGAPGPSAVGAKRGDTPAAVEGGAAPGAPSPETKGPSTFPRGDQ